jgi:hypothetical protein
MSCRWIAIVLSGIFIVLDSRQSYTRVVRVMTQDCRMNVQIPRRIATWSPECELQKANVTFKTRVYTFTVYVNEHTLD